MTVRGSVNVTSNFVRNIQIKHSDQLKSSSTRPNESSKNQPQISQYNQQFASFANNQIPLTIVDKPSIKNMFNELNPQFNCLPYKTASKRVTNSLIQETKNKISVILKENSKVSLMVDLWTDRRCRSFLRVNAHCLDGKWSPYTILLSCKRFKGSHFSRSINDS
ncbi:unnamed protein product [Brachionus calyciflorus]|uniref:Uncharacterized protein n=1 Tax=Brachionus calyciflorus TaxID=104777 RepID=A0A814PGZ7_9BILA|nr:unnamed protein product [Brachionus calyciflorus]